MDSLQVFLHGIGLLATFSVNCFEATDGLVWFTTSPYGCVGIESGGSGTSQESKEEQSWGLYRTSRTCKKTRSLSLSPKPRNAQRLGSSSEINGSISMENAEEWPLFDLNQFTWSPTLLTTFDSLGLGWSTSFLEWILKSCSHLPTLCCLKLLLLEEVNKPSLSPS